MSTARWVEDHGVTRSSLFDVLAVVVVVEGDWDGAAEVPVVAGGGGGAPGRGLGGGPVVEAALAAASLLAIGADSSFGWVGVGMLAAMLDQGVFVTLNDNLVRCRYSMLASCAGGIIARKWVWGG